MSDNYDVLPDLARLLDAALRAGWNALPYVDRLVEGLGLEPSGGPEPAEKALREALGLTAGESCELVSARHGIPCIEPAVIRLTGACACGHVTERRVCEGHGVPEEPLWCRACYLDGDDAHKCPVALTGAEAVVPAAMPGQVSVKHGPGCHCTPCLAEPSYREHGQVTP